ncbi:hypothetical protein ACOSQ2_025638 [Xanthoceras sorbifolium]
MLDFSYRNSKIGAGMVGCTIYERRCNLSTSRGSLVFMQHNDPKNISYMLTIDQYERFGFLKFLLIFLLLFL